jgi:hypothetical protein
VAIRIYFYISTAKNIRLKVNVDRAASSPVVLVIAMVQKAVDVQDVEEGARRDGHLKIRVARWYIFKTKKSNLGKFCRVLQWKTLVFFMPIWSILWPFGNICGHFGVFHGNLVYFPRFGMLYKEKSGNHGADRNSPTTESGF